MSGKRTGRHIDVNGKCWNFHRVHLLIIEEEPFFVEIFHTHVMSTFSEISSNFLIADVYHNRI